MFQSENSYQQDLVLLGGGHTHVLLIRSLAMRPILGVRITLISEKILTPYSGMLPGYVAGHYSLEQTNIDLNRLCQRAGIRWINDAAIAIDADRNIVSLARQAAVAFDYLSIDIGSTPNLSVKGARQFAVGVKPITGFQQRWDSLQSSLIDERTDTDLMNGDWGVIGAGAGGVELVLAMAHRMQKSKNLRFHLIYKGTRILPGYPERVVSAAKRQLRKYGINQHPGFQVEQVTAAGVSADNGDSIKLSESIWCTGATGAPWLATTGIDLNARHFIKVNRTLQSVSHPSLFAVGDIADMIHDPRPKAGVYAVRQAPQLEENLRRAFKGEKLREIKLQSQFLSLLSLGGKHAVASRNGLVVSGRWVWRWKDRIDQKFMRQFVEFEMPNRQLKDKKRAVNDKSESMPCAGCGSKLGPELLMANLNAVGVEGGALDGAGTRAEDASLWTPTAGTIAVQSIDGFRSFTKNEYLFAQICTLHATSDIFAMGAQLRHAQAWINLKFDNTRIQQRDHLRMLQGIVDALEEQGAKLIGGHSTQGLEDHLAIVANGELLPGNVWNKSGAQPGDALLLSKSLGTGVVLAADMQGQAGASAVEHSYASMLVSNQPCMQQLQAHSPHAVTDVTGFGLLGHLFEMLDASSHSGKDKSNDQQEIKLQAVINLSAVPTIPGALELACAGWRSSIYPYLKNYLSRCSINGGTNTIKYLLQDNIDAQERARVELLIDPQTSGGLLVSMTKNDANELLEYSTDFILIGQIQQQLDNSGDCLLR